MATNYKAIAKKLKFEGRAFINGKYVNAIDGSTTAGRIGLIQNLYYTPPAKRSTNCIESVHTTDLIPPNQV